MNVVKVLRACEKALLWNETVYLYKVRFVYLYLDLSRSTLLCIAFILTLSSSPVSHHYVLVHCTMSFCARS